MGRRERVEEKRKKGAVNTDIKIYYYASNKRKTNFLNFKMGVTLI